ncbi:MAG: hypothetical protein JWP69_1018 [Flaviaesturariibacter sp.]|nr:hypothetical protein [Flaviaesturariibacter sp.]
MKKLLLALCLLPIIATAQEKLLWQNVDSSYGPLPPSVHVFYTSNPIDTAPFRAFYVIADLKDKGLDFTTDTTYKRRFTPSKFYEKNGQPFVVVNGTFFSFETNGNLNVVVNDGRILSHHIKTVKQPADTTKKVFVSSGAIGIDKKRNADIAWIKGDSLYKRVYASQFPVHPFKKGNFFTVNRSTGERKAVDNKDFDPYTRWKVKTAIGGGPVLVQEGEIKVTNEEERMFAGKAINDKHPRTAMGYTADNKLIILVVEGRNSGIAGGATLTQEAQILKDLGCIEALNLDGGGSSCLLINGKETIKPSDKEGQRAVPAVFIIKKN